jgi:hypothetical protein
VQQHAKTRSSRASAAVPSRDSTGPSAVSVGKGREAPSQARMFIDCPSAAKGVSSRDSGGSIREGSGSASAPPAGGGREGRIWEAMLCKRAVGHRNAAVGAGGEGEDAAPITLTHHTPLRKLYEWREGQRIHREQLANAKSTIDNVLSPCVVAYARRRDQARACRP